MDWFRRRKRNRQRLLFSYFDGWRTSRVDPLRVHRDLELHPEFSWDMGFLIDQGDAEATDVAIRATCEVFAIHRWDPATEQGMIGAEILSVLFDYSEYVEAQKKNSSPGLTSPPPTESESSTSVEPTKTTTKCCSGCTSTPTEPNFDSPPE